MRGAKELVLKPFSKSLRSESIECFGGRIVDLVGKDVVGCGSTILKTSSGLLRLIRP